MVSGRRRMLLAFIDLLELSIQIGVDAQGLDTPLIILRFLHSLPLLL